MITYPILIYRKSFEFEDIQSYRNRLAAIEYKKLHEELNGTTRVCLYCTQSEDNLYEDIIGKIPDLFKRSKKQPSKRKVTAMVQF